MASWLHATSGWWLLAQGESTSSDSTGFTFLIPMAIIMALAYFFLIRPQQRKQAEQTQLIDKLKKNDRVVTIGGILGTVVNVQKDEVVIRVDENTNARMHVLSSAISRVVSSDGANKKDDGKS